MLMKSVFYIELKICLMGLLVIGVKMLVDDD